VPNFVVRRLKAGTPHRTLRHSNDLSRVEQDGWKGPYLCAGCEGIFSEWEDSFCREIYDPLLKGGVQTFALSEKSALFACLSIFGACIKVLSFGSRTHGWRSGHPGQDRGGIRAA